MKVARTAVGAAALDGIVYAIGGECALEQPQDDETLYMSSIEAFDTQHKKWHERSAMRVARSFVASCSLSGYIYAIGKKLGYKILIPGCLFLAFFFRYLSNLFF